MPLPSNPKGRLCHPYRDYEHTDLGDFMKLVAYQVEDVLLDFGAVPGVDYSLVDVLQVAAILTAPRMNELEIATPGQYECDRYSKADEPSGGQS